MLSLLNRLFDINIDESYFPCTNEIETWQEERVKLKTTFCGWLSDSAQRGFSMTVPSANQLGMGKGKEADQEHAYQTSSASGEDDWVLRFANENGFLSWCRNSYLTTVVAIAMMAEGTTPLALQAAEGAFFVSGLNLTWGTYHYIYNLLRLRRKMGMSAVGALMYFSMAVLHLGLWFVVCTLFLGYTDETADSKLVGLEEKSAAEQGDDV
ncbi:transmembrane protein 160-like isoform X3 [Babylonia areolata]|uniref:transmembrane protein 160-like isoform X3 n=1 Tax=Babylonia areolata TaxID=304850 RepID=UPI003FD48CF7